MGFSASFPSGLISGFTALEGNNPASEIGNVSWSVGFVSAAFTTLLSSFFPDSNRSSSSRGEVVFDCTGLLGFVFDFGCNIFLSLIGAKISPNGAFGESVSSPPNGSVVLMLASSFALPIENKSSSLVELVEFVTTVGALLVL